MAQSIFSTLQKIWPFSLFKNDDLKVSVELVQMLSIPEQTKQFVFAIKEPISGVTVYILAAQALSEQSGFDADYLIKEVRPKVVIAQVPPLALTDIQAEEKCTRDAHESGVPTSPFGVLTKCFRDNINREQYEKIAGCQMLQEIFGVGLYGHVLAAKSAAVQVGSSFLILESPYENVYGETAQTTAKNSQESLQLNLQENCLVPNTSISTAKCSSSKFLFTNASQEKMLRSLIPLVDFSVSHAKFINADSVADCSEVKLVSDYEVPPFALSVYPLLTDLYHIFATIPSMGKALASTQQIISRIHKGETISNQLLWSAYSFRIAIEGLRLALNNSARHPIDTIENARTFSELPYEEKCHVLFAEALKSQARNSGSLVAIVDASCLNGIRKHWKTHVPSEIAELAAKCFIPYIDGGTGNGNDADVESTADNAKKTGMLTDNPVVAVGAGATAILGASSLSKAFHASTLWKVASYKVPIVLKHAVLQLKRNAGIGLGKILSHGMVSTGSQASTFQVAASAEKARAFTHSVIASAEKTSLLAMRTSLYGIFLKRKVNGTKITPWVTFGCSMTACTVLLMHGDGIECVFQSIPSVPMIASLGRGLENLRMTSQELRQTSGTKVHEALQSMMHGVKKLKIQ